MTQQEAVQLIEIRDQQAFSLCSKISEIDSLDTRNISVVVGMIAAKLVAVTFEATTKEVNPTQGKLFIESFLMDLSLHTGLTFQMVEKEGKK